MYVKILFLIDIDYCAGSVDLENVGFLILDFLMPVYIVLLLLFLFDSWGSINEWLVNERCITFSMQRQHDLGLADASKQ